MHFVENALEFLVLVLLDLDDGVAHGVEVDLRVGPLLLAFGKILALNLELLSKGVEIVVEEVTAVELPVPKGLSRLLLQLQLICNALQFLVFEVGPLHLSVERELRDFR